MLPVVLSIVFPGLGQLYFGKWVRAAFMILLGASPVYPVALVWSVVDAYKLARAGTPPQFSSRETVVAVVLLVVVVPACVAALAFTAAGTFGWLKDEYLDKAATKDEGAEITRAIIEYQSQTGRYPENLAVLVQGRPLRADWLTDGWGRPYEYRLEGGGRSFRLSSAGRDGRFGTSDDLSWQR